MTGTGSDGVPMQQRLSTWAYDDQARAILSVKGALPAATPTASTTSITASPSAATTNPPLRGLEQVNLDFSTQGRTILTNSLGQQTTYRSAVIAGEYRLLEALGPGCATCGPTNVRYRYDARGRLLATTTLDARGQPLAATQVTIDAYSRPLQETRYTFVKGKPGGPGLGAVRLCARACGGPFRPFRRQTQRRDGPGHRESARPQTDADYPAERGGGEGP